MSIANFDALNTLSTRTEESKQHSLPYEQYFGDMKISEVQREQRIEVANDFEYMLLFMFSLIRLMKQYDAINVEYIESQVRTKYLMIVNRYVDDGYISLYANNFAHNIVQTTLAHLEQEYYLSLDRAMFIAENEANSSLNYVDYITAIANGKTKKQWISKKDKKVRKSHVRVDDKVIGIQETFLIGDSFMLFPKDTSLGADESEIINCRCSIKYS